jgi:hypothetical protein
MKTSTQTEQIKKAAFRALNVSWRILSPASEATVIFPEFDPCRARMPIAIVKWPCIVNMREAIATHAIHDGDAL